MTIRSLVYLAVLITSSALAGTTIGDIDSAASTYRSECSSSHTANVTFRNCMSYTHYCGDAASDADSAFSSAKSARSKVEDLADRLEDEVAGKEGAAALVAKARGIVSALPSLSECR